MTRHILVLNGNPDPSAERLSAALARAYCEGAEAAGHVVHRIDVGGVAAVLLQTGATCPQGTAAALIWVKPAL